jgi:hypothetical protein
MGFNNSSTNVSLVAKLTPLGRQRFATNSEKTLITTFALGDSDAYYGATDSLSTGQVPSESGDIGPNGSVSNSTAPIAGLKSFLVVNSAGITTKPIESMNSTVVTNQVYNGLTSISGANLSYSFINRNDYNTNSLVNLFYSFGLPLNYSDDVKFTGITYASGGYSDTGLSGMAQTNIIVIAINNSTYGDVIDGKQIKVHFETSATTYDIYGTFLNFGQSTKVLDTQYRESSSVGTNFDSNVVLLYCDDIQKPNNNAALSWATGFGLNKPFSLNSKQLSNLQTNTNTASIADVPVGVAYLDKGFVVLTHPSITSGYTVSATSATTIMLNSLSTEVYQTITCIANRGEFAASTNPTFSNGDVPRISEVGLFNNRGELMAIAKTDRQVLKPADSFKSFGVKIKF